MNYEAICFSQLLNGCRACDGNGIRFVDLAPMFANSEIIAKGK